MSDRGRVKVETVRLGINVFGAIAEAALVVLVGYRLLVLRDYEATWLVAILAALVVVNGSFVVRLARLLRGRATG